ncbi:PepSY domain-containing protein [Paraglaciecola sp. L1A13]|uniref:PepSY-associated TM helix domain-containing protein n=1 Tax=Paraglaciecola sp. L1A13 TaxID=2686359 RepID=UPI00131E346F|nr:PepSY-associated TM helix domain-containing protein [Paraglaciecola sp. L1A13]
MLSISPRISRQSLSGHGWLGLLSGALLYIICLSGAIAVFYPEFERWEQPAVVEYTHLSPDALQQAYEQVLSTVPARDVIHDVTMVLPTNEYPRGYVTANAQSYFILQDGSLGIEKSHPWKDLLVDLHIELHLPPSIGLVLVSLFGVLLCGLIISGFMAHRRIFKDAFKLRIQAGSPHSQRDLHNRLSVWAAPFHLMIGITGAYFGLAMVFAYVFSLAFYDGDSKALIADVFSSEPVLSQPVDTANITKALINLPTVVHNEIHNSTNNNAELDSYADLSGYVPFYVTVEDVGTPEQYIIVGVRYPQRLIYAEQYRFNNDGEYINKAGFSDGLAGRQGIFSVYRVHFGHFGNVAVQIAYMLLGIALSIVSVTGVNIWLDKRQGRDFINNAWVATVWGVPMALALSSVTQVVFNLPSIAVFWGAMLVMIGWSLYIQNENHCRGWLKLLTGVALMLLVAGYYQRFAIGLIPLTGHWINGVCCFSAGLFLYFGYRDLLKQPSVQFD